MGLISAAIKAALPDGGVAKVIGGLRDAEQSELLAMLKNVSRAKREQEIQQLAGQMGSPPQPSAEGADSTGMEETLPPEPDEGILGSILEWIGDLF